MMFIHLKKLVLNLMQWRINFKEMKYLSDSNANWREEIIKFINKHNRFQILIHLIGGLKKTTY